MSDDPRDHLHHMRMAEIAARSGVVYLPTQPGQPVMNMPRIAHPDAVTAQHQQAAALLSALARGGLGMNGVPGQGLLAQQPQQAPPAGLLAQQRPAVTIAIAPVVEKRTAKKSSGKKPAASTKKAAVKKSVKPASHKRK